MLPGLLLHPATLKALFIVAAPWLASGSALGILAGRQSIKNAQQHDQLARQQAEIDHLAAANAALAARLDVQASPAVLKKAQHREQHIKKHGFLKQILEANLKLREDAKKSTGEQQHG